MIQTCMQLLALLAMSLLTLVQRFATWKVEAGNHNVILLSVTIHYTSYRLFIWTVCHSVSKSWYSAVSVK